MKNAFRRNPANPLITPEMITAAKDLEVLGTFNPAAATYNGKTYLLVRVAIAPKTIQNDDETTQALRFDPETNTYKTENYQRKDLDSYEPRFFHYQGKMLLTSISLLYLATVENGEIQIRKEPILTPTTTDEEFGIEDPRITQIGDTYYITYVAVSRHGVAVKLAHTKDFVEIEKDGIILPPNNKDAVLFPAKVGGSYHLIHRPVVNGVPIPEIWYAKSPDLRHWGQHEVLLEPEMDWEGGRIGAGPPPIETEQGWLLFYHGATKENVYKVGAVLLAKEEPNQVLWRSKEPLLVPTEKYETDGFFGNVVFPTGIISTDNKTQMFYGAADTSCCSVEVEIPELLKAIQNDERRRK